jgi:hypothetical protein
MDYRVAGVITGSDGSLAIIERPEGASILVGPGDDIDGGEIVGIDDKGVRIRFPDEELLLPLSGGPAERLRLDQSEVASVDQIDAAHFDREVSRWDAMIEWPEISQSVSASDQTLGADADPKSDADKTIVAQLELADRLKALFDLPSGVRVVDINGEPVTTLTGALSQIGDLLDTGNVIRFGLDQAGAVYIFPQ